MYKVFIDALVDTAKMIPLLLIVYIGIEYLEFKFGATLGERVKHAGRIGPLIGAAFGCIPQCGFSVISTTLYTKRFITLGTLLAVYISTSDEAIPVILSQPDKLSLILPLLLTKIIIAIVIGYIIDITLKIKNKKAARSELCAATIEGFQGEPDKDMNSADETGCCGHHVTAEKPNYKELILHPIIHTVRVFFFIFLVSLILNLIIYKVGNANIAKLFLGHSIFQPMIAALIGLIPNCAASVAITQLFLKGTISFGSTIAGLSASAGLGMLVLFKENKDKKESFRIVGLLLIISIVSGIVLQFIFP